MDEVILSGHNGRALTLRRTSRRDSESWWTYQADLSFPEGGAMANVQEHGVLLAPFFRDLADEWRGFGGTREYDTLEGQLHLACTHDGLGTVECRVVLRQPWPPMWSIEAVLHFDAGTDLERIASELEQFVDAAA